MSNRTSTTVTTFTHVDHMGDSFVLGVVDGDAIAATHGAGESRYVDLPAATLVALRDWLNTVII